MDIIYRAGIVEHDYPRLELAEMKTLQNIKQSRRERNMQKHIGILKFVHDHHNLIIIARYVNTRNFYRVPKTSSQLAEPTTQERIDGANHQL